MQIEVDVQPNIECRGRNGWFNAERVTVNKFRDGNIEVGVVSSRPFRDCPPIVLNGPADQIKNLLTETLAAVEKAISTSAVAV